MDDNSKNSKSREKSMVRHRDHERGVPGGAYRKKQPLSEKVLDKLFGDDMMAIPDRLRDEMLLPRLEDLGFDLLIAAVSMAFGKEPRGLSRGSGGSRTRDREWREEDYSRYSDRPSGGSRRPRKPSYEYVEVQFRSREGALDALDYIMYYCDKYEQCPVAILYEKAGLSSTYTDRYYGWKDLSMLSEDDVLPGDDGGWVIDLPPVERVRVR